MRYVREPIKGNNYTVGKNHVIKVVLLRAIVTFVGITWSTNAMTVYYL